MNNLHRTHGKRQLHGFAGTRHRATGNYRIGSCANAPLKTHHLFETFGKAGEVFYFDDPAVVEYRLAGEQAEHLMLIAFL